MQSILNKTKPVITGVLILLLFFSIWRYWQFSTDHVGVDYYQLWMLDRYLHYTRTTELNFYRNEEGIGNYLYHDFRAKLRRKYGDYVLLSDKSSLGGIIDKKERRLFNVSEIRRSPRFYSSPFLFYFVGLFSLNDYSNSFKLFSCTSLFFFMTGCFLLFRLLRLRLDLSMLVLVAILLFYFPLIRSQQSGNVNELAFLPLVVYLYLGSRSDRGIGPFMAGMCLAISIALKPLTILLCLYELFLLIQKRFKTHHLFLGMLCMGFIIYIIPSIYYGFFIWTEWARKIPLLATDSLYYTQPMKIENYSFILALDSLFHSRLIVNLFSYVLIPAGIFSFIYFIKRLRVEFLSSRFFAASLLIIMALLINRLVWPHYFVFLVMIFIAIIRDIAYLEAGSKRAICTAGLMALFILMTGFFRSGAGYYLFSFTPLLLGALYVYTTYAKQGPCMRKEKVF